VGLSVAKDRLDEISRQLRKSQQITPVTTRDFLLWFDAQRRGYWVVKSIRRELKKAGLETRPDFESAYLDSPITFELAKAAEKKRGEGEEVVSAEVITALENTKVSQILSTLSAYADPTFRISKLGAANRAPTFIAPDAPVQQAVTVMLANDYSQMPVMTYEREVKGMISWTSIGTRLAVGRAGNHVRELMDGHHEIRAESSLFQAIPIIVEHQYVLIRGNGNKITGIVTASDLALQFQQLAEPFLLLGEIENHIRRILGDSFSTEELTSVRDPQDSQRKITSVADLSFGEYIRLLENDGRWKKVKLSIDRAVFCAQLNKVREIRNDVMHFDPDGILPADLERLRDFAHFLQRLQTIGVP
jgi:predicted transcriptional regulator